MKLTTFLLLVSILHVSAAGYSQKVTLNAKNMPLREVFAEIITQTGVSIIYSEKVLSNTVPVTFYVKDAPVQEVLELCLRNQQVAYALEGKNFVIKKLAPPAPAADSLITVTGMVRAPNNVPLS